MLRKWFFVYIGIVLLLGPDVWSVQGAGDPSQELAQHYQEFLKLTQYIILPQEREVFSQLGTDRDRTAFIETFWKQRDPTPGTPQNEYREEHLRRFNHANRVLGRSTPRQGWMTDQGRIYIILGPAVSVDRFVGSSEVYPTEAWSYYGDEALGLPPHFVVVFYKKRGIGEFVLYDPAADGPGSLLIRTESLDPTDYEQLYHEIEEVAPTLAPVTLSMIPGEIPFDFHPSIESNRIMTSIYELPAKDVNVSYATHFLDYKGLVSTDYMTNYVDSTTSLSVFPDPALGMNFVHFSIVPERVSVDYYEEQDQYYCNFKLTVSLREEERIILQYSKDLPVYIAPDDLESVLAHGLSIEDSFPAAAGAHRLVVLVQNSVQKEFCLFEQDVRIPQNSGQVALFGPFLGTGFQEYAPALHIPYKVGNQKLLVDPALTFSREENICLRILMQNIPRSLWQEGRLEVRIQGLRENEPSVKSFSRSLREMPLQSIAHFSTTFPSSDLTADYYTARALLLSPSGEVLIEQEENFIVSPQSSLTHPLANAKAFPHDNRFVYDFMLASQFEKLGIFDKAEVHYAEGFRRQPGYGRGVVDFARFYLNTSRFLRGQEVIENLKDSEPFRFEYLLIKGLALKGLQQHRQAVAVLLEANAVYNADTELLNALGACYLELDESEKALEVLQASLRLNPEQEAVREKIAEIQKK